jgi:hypothetical protein
MLTDDRVLSEGVRYAVESQMFSSDVVWSDCRRRCWQSLEVAVDKLEIDMSETS